MAAPDASRKSPAPRARTRRGTLGHLPELAYALAAIVAVTALYGLAYSQASAFPTASSLVGHGSKRLLMFADKRPVDDTVLGDEIIRNADDR